MTTQTKQRNDLTLQDENSFEFLSGLWTGKKPPYTKAVVIRNTNFGNDGKIDYSNIAILDVEAKQLQNRKLQNGDIIIERSGGGPKQPVGRVVYFDKETPEIDYSFSNFTSAIRVKNKDNFNPMYVFYFLHNFYAEGNTDHLQRRTTGIRNLDFSSYKESVIFPSISITEQKAIAQTLTTIQNDIIEQENLIAKLKELKRSMTQHLFTHGTKGEKTKMTEIGEIPESWEVVELIDVCNKPQYGFTDSAANKGNVRFLRITDITEDGVNWNSVPYCKCPNPERYLLKDGDIVFARIGATTGKSFLLRNPDNAVFASYLIMVRTKEMKSAFLYHYFQTDEYWKQIDSQKGTNLKGGVNGSILSKLLVPKCSEDEQARIARSINAIDNMIIITQKKLSSYQDLFKTMLHELMSGERRIK